jgi:hypothetical protein
MKFKNIMLLALLFAVLTIGAACASEDFTQDNLTVQMPDPDIQEIAVEDDSQELSASAGEDVLSQRVVDDNQNDSTQSGQPVLSSAITGDDITLKANSKTIDTTKGDTVIATFKVPKGAKGTVCLDFEESEEFNIKLSKLPVKKTKNGFTTYSLRVKDVNGRDLMEELKSGQYLGINLKYNNKYDGPNSYFGFSYLVKVNKKAKTIKLKWRKETDVWIGPYDRKSGSNKKMTVHLETWRGKHPLAHKKVKITINGVVYVKKTNSKGLIKLYPPKYLPPKQYLKVRMEYAGNDKYTECMTINEIQIYKNPGSSKSKISAGKKTFVSNQTKKYTVKLTSKGKAIKKAKLKLTINGKKFSAKTNSKGKATFNLSKFTKKGNFKTTVVYMGDKRHYMSYKNVKLTVK